MAFLTLRIVGSVEVIVFHANTKDFRQRLRRIKDIVTGEVNLEENAQGKIIANSITEFDQIASEVWLKFRDKDDYLAREQEVYNLIQANKGNDKVVIYLEKENAKKILPIEYRIKAEETIIKSLEEIFGKSNVGLKH